MKIPKCIKGLKIGTKKDLMNGDECVETQEKELDLNRKQNYSTNHNESLTGQQKELNVHCVQNNTS